VTNYTLPLRNPLKNSLRTYKMNMGSVVASNESPESDGDGLSDEKIFTMTPFPPIPGHAVLTDGYLCNCELMYMNVDDYGIPEMVSKLPVKSLERLAGPDPNNRFPSRLRTTPC
jgi:hypothetical protein